MKQLLITVLLLFLLRETSVAQNDDHIADSLKQILNAKTTDSAKAGSLYDVAYYYSEVNRDSSLHYLDKLIALSKKNSKELDEATALDLKGYVLMWMEKSRFRRSNNVLPLRPR